MYLRTKRTRRPRVKSHVGPVRINNTRLLLATAVSNGQFEYEIRDVSVKQNYQFIMVLSSHAAVNRLKRSGRARVVFERVNRPHIITVFLNTDGSRIISTRNFKVNIVF